MFYRASAHIRHTVFLHVRAMTCGLALIVEQASSRGPPGTGQQHPKEPARVRTSGPDALAIHLPLSHALLLKGERCGVAAPRITAPHYSSTHSQTAYVRIRGARRRLTRSWSAYFLPTLHNCRFECFLDSIS